MTEPTDEMIAAYFSAATKQAGKVAKAKRPAELDGTIARAGLAAVLAIVERDRGLERDVVLKAKRWAASSDSYDTDQLLSAVDQLEQYQQARDAP
jgi:hypothetical protein